MSTATAPRPAGRRYFTPVNILLLGALLAGGSWLLIRIDTGHRTMAVNSAAFLTIILLAIWVAFRSGLPASQRALRLLLLATPFLLLRIDGCQGDLTPIIVWRWSQKPDFALARSIDKPAESTTIAAVDLKHTTEFDYPRFLGSDNRATITNVALDPDWTAHPPKELWRHPVGAGWSGFSVVGEFAVTQEQRGDVEAVICYHLRTGEPAWMQTNPGRHDTAMGGVGPRATPTIDRGVVYTLGAEGWLQALDGATGKPIWGRNILKEHDSRIPDWGKSASPLVVDELVITSVGGDNGRAVAAYQRATGEPVWHAGDESTSYASPILATLGDTRQIVMLNAASVTGHDLATGKVLWRYDWPGLSPKVTQPIAIDDHRLLVGSGYGYGCKLLDITHSGDSWKVDELWSSTQLNPKMMNPIVVGEHLYGLDDGVALACLELATGKRLWKKGRYGHGQIIRVGELLLVQAETGEVALVEASPQAFKEVARFKPLVDRTWNNPTLRGNLLLVRNDIEAACYELPLRK